MDSKKQVLYGAQTVMAMENFPISGQTIPVALIHALGFIKAAAAKANHQLGWLEKDVADSIVKAALEVAAGQWDDQFPVDIYQTGSGTSTNMNVNEVIANRAQILSSNLSIHPNDHVNLGQSSNDTIPTAIRIASAKAIFDTLLSCLEVFVSDLSKFGQNNRDVLKTARTHLMDAMPVSFDQIFGGYAKQITQAKVRIEAELVPLLGLPQGGTAVGSGVNAHPDFPQIFCEHLSKLTDLDCRPSDNPFASQSNLDDFVALSSALKGVALALLKILNDIRWMKSGPVSGLNEVQHQSLQPGSSIMPGKVNPVIEESATMVCLQVMGNDAAIQSASQTSVFELNVTLPLVAARLEESIRLLSAALKNLSTKMLPNMWVNARKLAEDVGKNPILITGLSPKIGYDLATKIVKKAMAENRTILQVATEMTDLTASEIAPLLDPLRLISPLKKEG